MVKKIKTQTSKSFRVVGYIETEDKGSQFIKYGKDYLKTYLLKNFLKTKIISDKNNSFVYTEHEKDFGINAHELITGKYTSLIGEYKNYLLLLYNQEDNLEILNSSLGSTHYFSKTLFQIFEKEQKINTLDKLFNYKKFPSIKCFNERINTEKDYLRGTNYQVKAPLLSLFIKNDEEEYYLELTSKDKHNQKAKHFETYFESAKTIQKAEEEIKKHIELTKNNYPELEKILENNPLKK